MAYDIVSTSDSLSIRKWSVKSDDVTLLTPENNAFSISYSPDGRSFASGHHNGSLSIWSAQTCKREQFSDKGHSKMVRESIVIYSVLFSIFFYFSLSCAGNSFIIQQIRCVRFSKDGKMIVTAGYDLLINVWDSKTLSIQKTLTGGHTDWPFCCCFSPDGKFVVSGGRDNMILIWSLETGTIVKQIKWNNWIWSVGYSRDGNYFCSVGDDRELTLWNPNNFEKIRSVYAGCELKTMAFRPNSTMIAVGGGQFLLYSLPNLQLIRKLDGHTNTIWCCDFSKDGKYVVSGSWDRTLIIYETETGVPVKTLLGHESYVWGCSFSSAFYLTVMKRLLRLCRLFSKSFRRINFSQRALLKLVLRTPLEYLLNPIDIETVIQWGLSIQTLGETEENYLNIILR